MLQIHQSRAFHALRRGRVRLHACITAPAPAIRSIEQLELAQERECRASALRLLAIHQIVTDEHPKHDSPCMHLPRFACLHLTRRSAACNEQQRCTH